MHEYWEIFIFFVTVHSIPHTMADMSSWNVCGISKAPMVDIDVPLILNIKITKTLRQSGCLRSEICKVPTLGDMHNGPNI